MHPLTLLYLYLGVTAGLVFVLLFGEAPWAAGTPLAWASWLLREGWVIALEAVVTRACGQAGLRLLDSATEACCERSNPCLQFAYIVIWSVGYGLYWEHIFMLLPGSGVPLWHLYTGTAALCATLATFLAVSASSPGAVTPDNVQQLLAAYPPDGRLFPAKECPTCQLPRPGRSKHCGLCGSCVPRFDHHCAWVNVCVGLNNTRLFLVFLTANAATCGYALALGVAVMRGELARRGLLDLWVFDHRARARVRLVSQPARLAELLLARYPVQVALGLFIAVGGAMMAAFLAYQCFLINAGSTTHEAFKRSTVSRQEAAAAGERAAAGGAARQQPGQVQGRRRRARAANNKPYDRGVWLNWAEVLAPHAFLLQHQQQHHEQQQQPLSSSSRAGSSKHE